VTDSAVPLRRQARFCATKVIPPEGFHTDVWYEVCQGRRREDNRPGIVLLDVGDRRIAVAEMLLEVREVPAEAPRAALPSPQRREGDRAPRRRTRVVPARPTSIGVRLAARPGMLVAMAAGALVPLGMAAGFALSRFLGVRDLAT
jgi:hypothetical protein